MTLMLNVAIEENRGNRKASVNANIICSVFIISLAHIATYFSNTVDALVCLNKDLSLSKQVLSL